MTDYQKLLDDMPKQLSGALTFVGMRIAFHLMAGVALLTAGVLAFTDYRGIGLIMFITGAILGIVGFVCSWLAASVLKP